MEASDAQKAIKKFKCSLKNTQVTGAVVYGSWAYGIWKAGKSDIDVVLFAPKRECMTIAKNFGWNDKKPVHLNDHIGDRVEVNAWLNGVLFDVTLVEHPLKKYTAPSVLATHGCYDGVDCVVGGIYQRGILIDGNMSDADIYHKRMVPFYSEDVRKKRMQHLEGRIVSYLKKINDPDNLDALWNARRHFVRWIFIRDRKYPVSYTKHIDWQFRNILEKDGKPVVECCHHPLHFKRFVERELSRE